MDYIYHLESFVDDYKCALEDFERGNFKRFFRNYRPAMEELCVSILSALFPNQVSALLDGTLGFNKSGKTIGFLPTSAKQRTGKYLIDLAKMAILKVLSDEKASKLEISHLYLAYYTLVRDYHFSSCACHSFTEFQTSTVFDRNIVSQCIVGTSNFIDYIVKFFPNEGKKLLAKCPCFSAEVKIYAYDGKPEERPLTYTSAAALVITDDDDPERGKRISMPKKEHEGFEEAQEDVPDPNVEVEGTLKSDDYAQNYPEVLPEYSMQNVDANITLNPVEVDAEKQELIRKNLEKYKPFSSRPQEFSRPTRTYELDDLEDVFEDPDANRGIYYEHNNYMRNKYRNLYKGEVQTETGLRYQVPKNECPEIYDEAEVYFDIKAIPNLNPSKPPFLIAINVELANAGNN